MPFVGTTVSIHRHIHSLPASSTRNPTRFTPLSAGTL